MLRNFIRAAAVLLVAAAAVYNTGATLRDLGFGEKEPGDVVSYYADYPADGDDCSAGDLAGAPADDLTPADGSRTWRGPAYAVAASYAEPEQRRSEARVTVYVTRTGEKYHRAGCQHLRRSSSPLSLSEAKRAGYTPCKVCRPAR